MNCEQFKDFLEKYGLGYADSDFQQHRGSCSACREFAFQTELIKRLRQSYAGIEAPAHLEAKIKAFLATSKPRQPFFVTFLKSAFVVSVGVLMMAVMFQLFQKEPEISEATFKPYYAHLHDHASLRPRLDKRIEKEEQIKEYLTGYPLKEVPRLPEEATLEGISLCRIENRKVVHLFYRLDGEELHVLIYPWKLRKKGTVFEGGNEDLHAIALSSDDFVCLFAGKLPLGRLKAFVQKMRLRNRGA